MILLISILIICAIFSTRITERLGIPALLAFLGLGMLFGSDVFNLIYFDDALLTQKIANICLVFILFEGGFRTRKDSLTLAFAPSFALATVGVASTALLLGLIVNLFLGFELQEALLIGAILSSTDAAAVMTIMSATPVASRVSSTLELESAANDPMAILMTVTLINLLAGEAQSVKAIVFGLLWQFVGGIVSGYATGKSGVFLFNKLKSENQGYYYVLSIGVCLLAYGVANFSGANGIIAVFFAGMQLGNSCFAYKKGISHFISGVSICSNMGVFLLLGLLVFPGEFAAVEVWLPAVCIALALMLVVRPIVVFVCSGIFHFSFSEKIFMSWGGIKGAVPIVLATYPAALGLERSTLFFNIVFFSVLFSCLIQGGTLTLLARKLKLLVKGRPKSAFAMELHSTRLSDTDILEVHVDSEDSVAGKRISEIKLPADSAIVSIIRGEGLIVPRGNVCICNGDIVFILANQKDSESIINEFRNGCNQIC